MTELFSKSRLNAFVEEFVKHSKALRQFKVTKTAIARAVFPEDRNDPQNALSRLWERCSDKSPRRLDAADLLAIVDACRSLLGKQLTQLGQPDVEKRISSFEKGVCRLLSFAGDRATLDDFCIDRGNADTISAADFGVPDILAWHDQTFGFATELLAVQKRSIEALPGVVDQIGREGDDRRRLKLLEVALSISALNHPGTRWHEQAFNLALTAASKANLLLLTKGYGVPEDLRHPATNLDIHLNWSRFIPTLNSSTNYLAYAVQAKPLPPALWDEIRCFVEQAILTAERYSEMRPTDESATEALAAALSIKARFLAVLGRADAMREADKLHKESLRASERMSVPYGYAYPIVKHIVRSQFKAAIRCCEEAAANCQLAGNLVSAAAFGALQFHLTDLCGRGPTSDIEIRKLAADSLASPTVRYKCSHIFDASAVERLLARN